MSNGTTVWQRIAAVSKACAYLKKDGMNQAQRYNYVSEGHVKERVTAAMCDAGLAFGGITSEVMDRSAVKTRNGEMPCFLVRVTVTIVDQVTGSMVTMEGLGSGADAGDKAVMKAQTAAVKNALLHGFGIASGDDPEADETVDRATAQQRAPYVKPTVTPVTPPQSPQAQRPAQSTLDHTPPGATSTPDPGTWVVPFGKHKGSMLRDVPRDYVEWMYQEMSGKTNDPRWGEQNAKLARIIGAYLNGADYSEEARTHSAPKRGGAVEAYSEPDDDDDFPF